MTDTALAPVRTLPWGAISTGTGDALTASQAIAAAGLDWDVKLHSLYAQIGKNKKKIHDRFAVVRQDTEDVLGTVGQRYQIFQNREAFSFTDNLVDDGSAKYTNVGSLKNGRVIFLTMRLPTDIKIAGEDAHDLYLVLRTSHDGTKAVGVYVTPIRVQCMNQMTMTVKGARQSWQMMHTKSIEGKVQEARASLRMTFDYASAFAAIGDSMVKTKITDDMLVDLLESALPDRPKTEDNIEQIMDVYHNSQTNGFQGTAWGGYNAVTEWLDHYRPSKTPEGSFISSLDGQVARLRATAAERFTALV